MDKQDWFNKVVENKDVLRNLVESYHPRTPQSIQSLLSITAPNAEVACQAVRHLIQKESGNPLSFFDKAIEEKDTTVLANLFSDTWFGVPESTSCWNIPGFRLLVDLLDDPIEPEEPFDIGSGEHDVVLDAIREHNGQ